MRHHLVLTTIAVVFAAVRPAPAAAVPTDDDYTLWRRLTVDLCQRLPTLEEVACIEANGDLIPSRSLSLSGQAPDVRCDVDFDTTLDECIESESFAEVVALGINDFDLPSSNIAVGDPTLKWKTATFADAGEVKYWYARGWGDCLRGVNTRSRSVDDYLDRAEEPYFASDANIALDGELGSGFFGVDDEDVPFTYVCKETRSLVGSVDCSVDGATEATASLTNDEIEACTPESSRNRSCVRAGGHWPCGCGPNLRWCQTSSAMFASGTAVAEEDNSDGTGRWNMALKNETFQLVKQVVLGSSGLLADRVAEGSDHVPFVRIFDADYSIRSSKLQMLYDSYQANFANEDESDACYRQLAGLDISDATDCDHDVATRLVPYVDWDVTGADGVDWQVVPFDAEGAGTAGLAYRGGGILTHLQFLLRQPSEPNVANRVYSYWTCEDVSWKGWDLTREDDADDLSDWYVQPEYDWVTEPLRFSPLLRTTTAMTEPLEDYLGDTDGDQMDANCQGCHVTVNPLAAFRNFWGSSGRYNPGDAARALGKRVELVTNPDHEAYGAKGVFLGVEGNDLAGLGAIMASSERVHRCIANRVVHWLTGEMWPTGSDELERLVSRFVGSDYDLREVYRSVITSEQYRRLR